MATKTLKVKQIAAAGRILFAVVEDGSVWHYGDDNEWIELPAIEVDENAEPEDES